MNEDILQRLKKITPEEQTFLDGRTDIDTAIYNLNRNSTVDYQQFIEKGKLIDLRLHTRFVHFPAHTHNYVEVVYMYSGQTHHVINHQEILLNTGELLFLSQNATQEIYAASENDIAVNFIILPEFFDPSLGMIGNDNNLIRDFIIECLKDGSHNISYLHFKVSDILPIQNLMENLIWTLLHKQPSGRNINQTTMGLVFLHLLDCTENVDIGKDSFEQELMFATFRFIEENYRSGELNSLCELLGYDLYWMSRMIKKITGKNYTELLQEKRLKQAAYLLAITNLSITDISLKVGYSNFSYFYRLFRAQYSMSPKEYRVQVQQNEGLRKYQ